MSNKELWDRVCKTDPKHVKPITGKDYSGNSPKPYWIIERLTEEFGPCGIGWGYTIDSERFERFSETDCLHIAKVTLWYSLNGLSRGEITQMGQTKATYVTSKGAFKVDEDAPKKSVTDALVKCASYLGFAGDIFSGRWDDSKYVAGLRKEFAADNHPDGKGDLPQPRSLVIKATDGIENHIPEDRRAELDEMALNMIDAANSGSEMFAINAFYSLTDNDEKVYVWKCLAAESKLRATIKRNNPNEKEAA